VTNRRKTKEKATVVDFLTACQPARRNPDRVADDDLLEWLAQETGSTRLSCRWAFHVGRILLYRRQQLGYGQVKTWEEKTARKLKRSPRSIRLYVQVAKLLQGESATALPVSILDRPLREVPQAVRRKLSSEPTVSPAKPVSASDRWARRASKLLSDVVELDDGLDLLTEHLQQAEQMATALKAEKERGRVSSPLGSLRRNVPPIVRHPGGKTGIVDVLTGLLGNCLSDDGLVYREPFVGGGVVALNLLHRGLAKRVRLNDADPAIASLWTATIRQPDELKRRVRESRATKRRVKRLCEEMLAGELSGLDLALAKLVITACSVRGKSVHPANVSPTDEWQWNPSYEVQRIEVAHHLLRDRVEHGECTCVDAIEVIREPGACVIYADPPFASLGPDFYPSRFTETEHRSLADTLHEVTDSSWLLSYDDDPLVRQLYDGDCIEQLTPRYRGSSRRRGEVLICRSSDRHRFWPTENVVVGRFGG